MMTDITLKKRIQLLVNKWHRNFLLVFTKKYVLSAASADNLEIELVQKMESLLPAEMFF